MKLITELNWNDNEVITEEKNGKKSYFIEGIFMQSEIKNRNGRIYPRGVMEDAVGKYITEKVDNSTAYGELNHPTGPTINGDRISHLIESLRWDGNDVIGRAKIFDTPMGMTVQKILEGGGRLGVSSRGLGSIRENKGAMYVENFHLATAADIVTDPSAPKAFVNGILEGVEFGEFEPAVQQQVEDTKTALHKMTTKQIEENTLLVFESFLKSLSNK